MPGAKHSSIPPGSGRLGSALSLGGARGEPHPALEGAPRRPAGREREPEAAEARCERLARALRGRTSGGEPRILEGI